MLKSHKIQNIFNIIDNYMMRAYNLGVGISENEILASIFF